MLEIGKTYVHINVHQQPLEYIFTVVHKSNLSTDNCDRFAIRVDYYFTRPEFNNSLFDYAGGLNDYEEIEKSKTPHVLEYLKMLNTQKEVEELIK